MEGEFGMLNRLLDARELLLCSRSWRARLLFGLVALFQCGLGSTLPGQEDATVEREPGSLGGQGELEWRELSPLPDRAGLAGGFGGVVAGGVLFAGGANFPERPPWEGGQKVWHSQVWWLASPSSEWQTVGRLPRPLAYGVSASGPAGLVCVGGSDALRHYADCFCLQLVDGEFRKEELPALPLPLANACGVLWEQTLFVFGGTATPDAERPEAALWALDLKASEPAWKRLEDCPGGGRLLATAAASGDSIYFFGGADLKAKPEGGTERIYCRDAWSYRPGQGWKELAEIPLPIVAAPSPALVNLQGEIILLGGDTGEAVGFQPPEKHPGFSNKRLVYNPATDSWREGGISPAASVTAPLVAWKGGWVLVSGETRPGVRSPQVWSLKIRGRK